MPKSDSIPPQWLAYLHQLWEAEDLGGGPVVLRFSEAGAPILKFLDDLGASWRQADKFFHWTASTYPRVYAHNKPLIPTRMVHGDAHVWDFQGAVAVELDGERYLILRVDMPGRNLWHVDAFAAIAAKSLDDALGLAARIKCRSQECMASVVRSFGNTLDLDISRPIVEGDLILEPELKTSLLNYTDRFWTAVELCQTLGISPSKGMLLVGSPGTGKTLVAKHFLSRYPNVRRFVFVTESHAPIEGRSFTALVEAVNESNDPALVIIEDIDRLLKSPTITPELLLNVLDGLLAPKCPVLWIATSNDPTDLEENILNRPGRFDRVIVFPNPEYRERELLFERYSPWRVQPMILHSAAQRASGLTGAHIREACYSAALAAAEDPESYSGRLVAEVTHLLHQAGAAKKYAKSLSTKAVAGFGQ